MQTQSPQATWLHLSDLHFEQVDRFDRRAILKALLAAVKRFTGEGLIPELVFVTGDIGKTGAAADYAAAEAFFDALLATTGLTKEHLVIIPGNHDVDRTAGAFLKRTLSNSEESEVYFQSATEKPHFRKMKAYHEWYNKYFAGVRIAPVSTTCGPAIPISFGPWKLGVLPINSALFAQDDNDYGALWIGRGCLDTALTELHDLKPDFATALLHHPLEWLHEEERTQITSRLRAEVDCVLRGHLHKTDVEDVVGASGRCFHIAAGAAYQTNLYPNRAHYVTLTSNEMIVFPIRYEDSAETWTLDPSVYPLKSDHRGRYALQRILPVTSHTRPSAAAPQLASEADDGRTSAPVEDSRPRPEYEDDLFQTPAGLRLYAEPRLMTGPQEISLQGEISAERVSIEEILRQPDSWLIQTKPEYGGTTLCKRLEHELLFIGERNVCRKDARSLPNYRKKLEGEFPPEVRREESSILIIDHLDVERDERLLRELSATKWFKKVIAVTVDRSLLPAKTIDLNSLPFGFKELFLWNIERSAVRGLAQSLFETEDAPFVSGVVDKVYNDLLALCIPLTPANVIMYLRVLHREGEFHPLNRVHILARYLQEALRRPSDDYRDSFNAKNKMDVLSAFVFKMYKDDASDFGERYWFNFIEQYQKETLTEFDGSEFLSELIESRIIGKFQTMMYFKYSFYYYFFLGRHIAVRRTLLQEFLDNKEYLRMGGIVDVITGISPDNTELVSELTSCMEEYLAEFHARYVPAGADPLITVQWPDHPEEETLWKAVESQIEAPPRTTGEIDLLKSSVVAEARTADQQVSLKKFSQLESAIFGATNVLTDSLRNSDDIHGDLKLKALDALYRSHLVTFQIGAVFADTLSKRRYFRWGGIAFLEFNTVIRDAEPGSAEASFAVVDSLSTSVAYRAAEEIGSKKLGPVFRAREQRISGTGFLDLVNFHCLLHAKPQGWEILLAKAIERTDKNAYYLSGMLEALMISLENDLLSGRDRERIKRLIAVIRAKREFGKQAPGAKAVGKMLEHLERHGAFNKGGRD